MKTLPSHETKIRKPTVTSHVLTASSAEDIRLLEEPMADTQSRYTKITASKFRTHSALHIQHWYFNFTPIQLLTTKYKFKHKLPNKLHHPCTPPRKGARTFARTKTCFEETPGIGVS